MLRQFRSSQAFHTKLATLTHFLPSSSSVAGRRHFSSRSSAEEVERLPNEDTPWLMLDPEIDEATGDKLERFYSPAENRWVKLNRKKCLKASNSAVCVASTLGGWLGYAEPSEGAVKLSNPYLNKAVQLPSVTKLPCVLDFKRDHATGSLVTLKLPKADLYRKDGYYWTSSKSVTESKVRIMFANMAMSSSESILVALQGQPGRLAYCNTNINCDYGHGYNANNKVDSEWLGLQEDYCPGVQYKQAVYSSTTNLFYTISKDSGIQAFDLENDTNKRSKMVMQFSMRHIQDGLREAAKERRNAKLEILSKDSYDYSTHYYLAVSYPGELFLLVRHFVISRGEDVGSRYTTVHFDVFEVDFEYGMLEIVETLEYDTLFVGLNQSFTVLGNKMPEIRPNCIYFTDHTNEYLTSDWGYDNGIFDLSANSILPLEYEELERVPFMSNYKQFWVPPRLLLN